jgi:NAD dependent epimerase/dehydratase family enzyme
MPRTGRWTNTTENSGGFSVEVARSWEAVANAFHLPHTRTVLLRCAMVMSRQGGVLPALAKFTRLGMGGRHGSGEQFVSWIHGAGPVPRGTAHPGAQRCRRCLRPCRTRSPHAMAT